jgi:hypothetical protein
MKISTIMVFSNKQIKFSVSNKSVCIIFMHKKGFFLTYKAAEMYRQCSSVYWITGFGKTSGGKSRDGTWKEITMEQKTLQLFLYLCSPICSIYGYKFEKLI